MECKFFNSRAVVIVTKRNNRNILECKSEKCKGKNSAIHEIIETYWNVNEGNVMLNPKPLYRNNRNILECKSRN